MHVNCIRSFQFLSGAKEIKVIIIIIIIMINNKEMRIKQTVYVEIDEIMNMMSIETVQLNH